MKPMSPIRANATAYTLSEVEAMGEDELRALLAELDGLSPAAQEARFACSLDDLIGLLHRKKEANRLLTEEIRRNDEYIRLMDQWRVMGQPRGEA